jgi:histidinol-phosphate/aromatic aminotransferase/cobyric acid decarboxylase-like protein
MSTRRLLEEELEMRLPDGLRALTDEELTDLAERVLEAKQRQSLALEVGIDEALEIVPRLVRGPVRKILFG